jgi:hypothetical protein
MQPSGIRIASGNIVMEPAGPWFARIRLARVLGKVVHDVLPGALASLIGTVLIAQYQFAHQAAPHPVTEQIVPASPETMARLRDEHAMIMDYLKTQMVAEQSRNVAEDAATARAAADAKAANARLAAEVLTQLGATTAVAKPAVPHVKAAAAAATVAAVPQAPLVIAQMQPDQNTDVAQNDRLASDPDSLLAKTLDIKDHVVAATRHVVSAIGDIFGSIGERIGGAVTGERQFSSNS